MELYSIETGVACTGSPKQLSYDQPLHGFSAASTSQQIHLN